MQRFEKPSVLIIFIFWTIATSLGWIVYPFLSLGIAIASWRELLNALLALAVHCLALGLLIGTGQWLVLKSRLRVKRWVPATALGYTAGFVIGTLTTIIISELFSPDGLTLGTPGVIFYPSPMNFMLGGFVIGAAQWTVLKRSYPQLEIKQTLLWILGNFLGLSLGLWLSSWINTKAIMLSVPLLIRESFARLIIGGMLGTITGAILLLLSQDILLDLRSGGEASRQLTN